MAKHENIWNVPNILTMLRMVLIGIFVWVFVQGHLYWAMVIFILASITDLLDGYIARKYNLVTNFGKLMDPLADKLMLVTALICLTTQELVPLWVVLVVALKELLMVVGGYFLLKHGIVVQARFIGKAATFMFAVAVVVTFLHDFIAPWDTYLQIVAVVLSVSAMCWYVVKTVRAVLRGRADRTGSVD